MRRMLYWSVMFYVDSFVRALYVPLSSTHVHATSMTMRYTHSFLNTATYRWAAARAAPKHMEWSFAIGGLW